MITSQCQSEKIQTISLGQVLEAMSLRAIAMRSGRLLVLITARILRWSERDSKKSEGCKSIIRGLSIRPRSLHLHVSFLNSDFKLIALIHTEKTLKYCKNMFLID